MNEKVLEYIYSYFEPKKLNEFQNDIPMDHFEITKEELNKLGINFKEVTERNKQRLYLKKNGETFYRYTKSFYPNNSLFGIKLANDKLRTEKFLTYGDVNTTESKVFKLNEFKKAHKLLTNSKEKMVLKPLSLDGGLGVFIDVTEENFQYAWKECVKAQKLRGIKDIRILIQKQVTGFEVRMIVTAGKFLSATLRVPAHVKGNGWSTIEELIINKNKLRQSNPLLKKNPIKINEKLEKLLSYKNKDLSTVLANNEFCILYPQSNMQHGGENYEISSLIDKSVKIQCEKIVSVFPGLHTAAIDLMIDSFDDKMGTVIEINKAPAFLLNYYPVIGEIQNPFEYIFKSLVVEDNIMKNRINYNSLTEEELNIIVQRYKFNYQKQLEYENIIKNMENEIKTLKKG